MSFVEKFKRVLGRFNKKESTEPTLEKNQFSHKIVDSGRIMQLSEEQLKRLAQGEGRGLESLQYSVLEMLCEERMARRLSTGFLLPSKTLGVLVDGAPFSTQDDAQNDYKAVIEADHLDYVKILDLPPKYLGGFVLEVYSNSANPNFSVEVLAEIDGRKYPFNYVAGGGIIELSEQEQYSLGAIEIKALDAWKEHKYIPLGERSEADNLRLLTLLSEAEKSGMNIDLAHLEKFNFSRPDDVGVNIKITEKGGLKLLPDLGLNIDFDDLEQRLHQLNNVEKSGILRIQTDVVLVEGKVLSGVSNIIENSFIPERQSASFLKTPSAYLDASVVNLDLGFSLRVDGIGVAKRIKFGEEEGVQNDWFDPGNRAFSFSLVKGAIDSKHDLFELIKRVEAAKESGEDQLLFKDLNYSLPSDEEMEDILFELKEVLGLGLELDGSDLDWGIDESENTRYGLEIKEFKDIGEELLAKAEKSLNEPYAVDWLAYARQPYDHQKRGVEWILGLLFGALNKESHESIGRIRGGLLADDMGLGKTYMSLIAIAEYYRNRRSLGAAEKPILVVAPLSLLENWRQEVKETFYTSPFEDIVTLQAGEDLNSYRIYGHERESEQIKNIRELGVEELESKIRYTLKIGEKFGRSRLDLERRLVLTTYDTLRNYQLSLCNIDWGLVIFDEAQHIKNASAMQTLAAKGLKSEFNLLVTGTPIENNLGEFWCLMDTAQPGLLGDYKTFQEQWIKPIARIKDTREQPALRENLGLELRKAVGPYMLRRTKEDELKDLPVKRVLSGVQKESSSEEYLPQLGVFMEGEQRELYDLALVEYQSTDNRGGMAFTTLAKLRSISLHPSLLNPEKIPQLLLESEGAGLEHLRRSGKTVALLNALTHIKEKNEKVIVFCITRNMQLLLKHWLGEVFGLNISIINGETKTFSVTGGETRISLIREFEAQEGFNIIIMSPIAAGTGLTVTGANHVIHFERHWNPAKEAQATDRVYRIGQKKDVFVYLPTLLHPENISFDERLDLLLSQKELIKDSVMVPEVVTQKEFLEGFL